MNYNKVISVLLIAASALIGLVAFRYLALPPGQTALWPLHALVFAAVAVALLAAVMPIIIHRVRRARGLPPEQSASDLRFTITLIAIICPLTFIVGFFFPMFGSLAIILVPIAYAFRSRGRGPGISNDRNT